MIGRFSAILIVMLALTACETPGPPGYPDITFSHLKPIKLDIGAVDYTQAYVPPAKLPNVDHLFPQRLTVVAKRWASERIAAVGPISRIARITLTGGGFRPGMFGRARIDVGTQPAVTLPTAAVLYRENRAGVFILDGEGRARFRPVAIVSRSSERTAVTGIEAGARIIVSGAGFLGEGDRVRVAPAAVAATPAVKAS